MRILCFIDNLGSGGAQRQLVNVACGLRRRGHAVRFLVYHPHDHFLPLLREAGISCDLLRPCSTWRRILEVRRTLRRGWQDVVLSFLEAPCFYSELARLPRQRWGLVVGERSANPSIRGGKRRWLRQFHRYADVIVANSHTNRLMLAALFSFLGGKVTTVYNAVDLQKFRPSASVSAGCADTGGRVFRIVVVASYQALKNMVGVAKALQRARSGKGSPNITLDWFGGMPADSTAYQQAMKFIAENDLAGSMRLHPATPTVVEEYARADAVGLFSFYEGLPNAICEGMACGKPILLSNICDAGNLVQDGKNGFVCDPSSVESMATAIRRMAVLGTEDLRRMGMESRKMAEKLFAEDVVVERYERILKAATQGKVIPADSLWPPEVPESALTTIGRWGGN